jgi:hypothetical protein
MVADSSVSRTQATSFLSAATGVSVVVTGARGRDESKKKDPSSSSLCAELREASTSGVVVESAAAAAARMFNGSIPASADELVLWRYEGYKEKIILIISYLL